jgi:hypothetical protein
MPLVGESWQNFFRIADNTSSTPSAIRESACIAHGHSPKKSAQIAAGFTYGKQGCHQ